MRGDDYQKIDRGNVQNGQLFRQSTDQWGSGKSGDPDYLVRLNTPTRDSARFLGKSPDLYNLENKLQNQLGVGQENDGVPTATVTSSIINMTCTIVGAGMLALPSAYEKTGVVIGMSALVFFGSLAAYTLCILAQVSRENGNASFRKMAKLTMPGRYTESIIEFMVAFNSFGLACSYLIVNADLWPQVIEVAVPGYSPDGLFNQRWFWILAIGCGVGLPLMLLKKLDSLQAVSSLGIAAVMYVVVVTVLYWLNVMNTCEAVADPTTHVAAGSDCVTWSQQCHPDEAVTGTGACTPAKADYGFPGDLIGMLEVLSLYATAYACTMNVPTIVKELKNNTQSRLNTVLCVSVAIVTACYAVEAWGGYASFNKFVNADLLKNFPAGIPATIARVAICINVLTSYPLQMHPTKKSISQLLWHRDADELGTFKYYAMTLTLFAMSLAVAFAVTDLGIILAYIGATTTTITGFVLPCWFYIGHLKLTKQTKRKKCQYYLTWVLFWITSALVPILTAAETLHLTGVGGGSKAPTSSPTNPPTNVPTGPFGHT